MITGRFDVWTKFQNECIHSEEFEDKELCMQHRCKLNNGWCYFSRYKNCDKKQKLQQDLFSLDN